MTVEDKEPRDLIMPKLRPLTREGKISEMYTSKKHRKKDTTALKTIMNRI